MNRVQATAVLLAAASLAAGLLLMASPAGALPVFAHRFDLTCQACHTTVPYLNAFGEAFLRRGFRLPGARPAPEFPLAAKINLAYASAPDPTGLPKATLDELEVLAGGSAGSRAHYFVEQYVVDGGRPGRTRDAWLRYDGAVSVKAGAFSLPLPVDAEDQRDTEAHYAVFDQRVGDDPFDLFDPRMGIDATFGARDGLAVDLVGLVGHDPGSGLPTDGVDRMLAVADHVRPCTISAYRYDGRRPIGAGDAFWREAFGAGCGSRRLRFDALLQRGRDSGPSASTPGPVASGGRYAQARWEFSPALAAVARLDAANDDLSGTARSFSAALIGRPARNARLTIEGDFARGSTVLQTALLLAY